MVSRDTRVQVVAVVVATVVVGVATTQFGTLGTGPVGVAVGLASYFLVLAGSHLYLAVRGDPGDVGVATRWRFVAVVAAVLALGGAALLAPRATVVGPLTLQQVLGGLAALVAAGWFVAESVAAYRDAMAEPR